MENPYTHVKPSLKGYISWDIKLDVSLGVIAYNILYKMNSNLICNYPIHNNASILFVAVTLTQDPEISRSLNKQILIISPYSKMYLNNYNDLSIEGGQSIHLVHSSGKLVVRKNSIKITGKNKSEQKKNHSIVFADKKILFTDQISNYEHILNNFKYVLIESYDKFLYNQHIIDTLPSIFPNANFMFFTSNIFKKPQFITNFNYKFWGYTPIDLKNDLHHLTNDQGDLKVMKIMKKFTPFTIPRDNIDFAFGENFKIITVTNETINYLQLEVWNSLHIIKSITDKSIQFHLRGLMKSAIILEQNSIFEYIREGFTFGRSKLFQRAFREVEEFVTESYPEFLDHFIPLKRLRDERFTNNGKTPKYVILKNLLKQYNTQKILIIVDNTLLKEDLANKLEEDGIKYTGNILAVHEVENNDIFYDICIFSNILNRKFFHYYISYYWRQSIFLAYPTEANLFHNLFLEISSNLIKLHNDRVKTSQELKLNEEVSQEIIYGNISNTSQIEFLDGPSFTKDLYKSYYSQNISEINNEWINPLKKICASNKQIKPALIKIIKEHANNETQSIMEEINRIFMQNNTVDADNLRKFHEFKNHKFTSNISNSRYLSMIFLSNGHIYFNSDNGKVPIVNDDLVVEKEINKIKVGEKILVIDGGIEILYGYIIQSTEYEKPEKQILVKNVYAWKTKFKKFMKDNELDINTIYYPLKQKGISVSKVTFRNWFNGDLSPLVPQYSNHVQILAEYMGIDNPESFTKIVYDAAKIIRAEANKFGRLLKKVFQYYSIGNIPLNIYEQLELNFDLDVRDLLSKVEILDIIGINRNVELPSNLIRMMIPEFEFFEGMV